MQMLYDILTSHPVKFLITLFDKFTSNFAQDFIWRNYLGFNADKDFKEQL